MSGITFTLSEGALTLPQAAQDHSLNILKFPQAQATLVITRAWDVKADEQDTFLRSQLEKIKGKMKKVVAGEVQDVQVGGQPGREVALRFENQHVLVHERLAITMLADHLLVLTLSRAVDFNDEAQALWDAIKAGLQITAGGEA